MYLLTRALRVCFLIANIRRLNCEYVEKVAIDSKGALFRARKSSGFQQQQHVAVDMQPLEGGFAPVQSKTLVRKERSSSRIALFPGLGNFFGASLLINRTRQMFWKLSHRHHDKAANSATSGANWINKTTANSRLVQTLLVFIAIGCILSGIIVTLSLRRSGSEAFEEPLNVQDDGGSGATASDESAPKVEKPFKREPEGLDEDLYGMGIAALIRDSHRFAMRTELFYLRVGRLAISLLVLVFTMTLQIFLLVEMKTLVTSVSTHEARDIYDKYEMWMYGNNTGNMEVTVNGYHRGKDGNFDISRFGTLDADVKESACQMPLSQPTFFVAILLVWSLVCLAEVRRTLDLAGKLLVSTPTIPSMKEALRESEDKPESFVVVGLTMPVKIVAAIGILVPRMAVSVILLWLGCRWLTGTMGFSDVLQNAVTLEFILLFKDLFYATMVPHHNKAETRNTLILPHSEKERPTASIFLGAFLWGLLAIIWVLFYVEYFQMVLPDYRWDIHDACADYLDSVEQSTPDAG